MQITQERAGPSHTSSLIYKTSWCGGLPGDISWIQPRVSWFYSCITSRQRRGFSGGKDLPSSQGAATWEVILGTSHHRKSGWVRRCSTGREGSIQWQGWCTSTHRPHTQAYRSPSNIVHGHCKRVSLGGTSIDVNESAPPPG